MDVKPTNNWQIVSDTTMVPWNWSFGVSCAKQNPELKKKKLEKKINNGLAVAIRDDSIGRVSGSFYIFFDI